MTAVEWLFQKLPTIDKYDPYYSDIIKQTKEMEKEQIIDAFGVGCHHESKRLVGYQDVAEQYYNETYGSKGSDDKKEPKDIVLGYKTSLEAQMLDSQLPQTEISDEKIKEIAEQEYKRYPNNNYLYGHSQELQLAYKAGVWDGIKWYREQLKSRQ